jgi:hypothetical protein
MDFVYYNLNGEFVRHKEVSTEYEICGSKKLSGSSEERDGDFLEDGSDDFALL